MRIHIEEYELIEEDGTPYFVVKQISTSREWLTILARNFGVGRRLEIPESARGYLPMLR